MNDKLIARLDSLNRTRLAEEVGVTRQHVSKVMRGRVSPSFELMGRLARACGVSFNQLAEYIQLDRDAAQSIGCK